MLPHLGSRDAIGHLTIDPQWVVSYMWSIDTNPVSRTEMQRSSCLFELLYVCTVETYLSSPMENLINFLSKTAKMQTGVIVSEL